MANRILHNVEDPSPDSNFAQINAIYPNEKASDWHRSYLTAALEHLLVWADIVAPLRFHPDLRGGPAVQCQGWTLAVIVTS